MTSETAPSSWLRETTLEKKIVRGKSSDYRPCVRMNRPGKEWRSSGESGESAGVMVVVIFSCHREVNPLVECACGQGLTVLPQSTPSHNYLNYSIRN